MSPSAWHFGAVYLLVICQNVTIEIISQITGVYEFTVALAKTKEKDCIWLINLKK